MAKKLDRVTHVEDFFSRDGTYPTGRYADLIDDQLKNPTVILIDPKFPHNIGNALRACAAFGAKQLWLTGDRALSEIGKRIPREERMKGYGKVQLIRSEKPLNHLNGNVTPICIELAKGAMPLGQFFHPANAAYVFGPEDGSVPGAVKAACHQFVYIESEHCLNLAAAINVVLYHRVHERYHRYGVLMPTLDEVRG